MLTDEDLTRELGIAFREATQDLTYAGRRRPQAATPIVLSTTAFAGAAAVGAIALAGTFGTPSTSAGVAAPRSGHQDASTSPTPHHGHLVTRQMRLAGMTLTYSYSDGQPDPVIATMVRGGLPDGVTAVSVDRTDVKVWAGVDPQTGDNAVFVQVADGDLAGKTYALLSPTWTQAQLIDLFENPVPVPMVTE